MNFDDPNSHRTQQPPPYGYPPQAPELAHWGLRVGADLLDTLIILGPMYALGFIDLAIAADPDTAGPGVFFTVGILYAIAMGFFQIFQEGSTGQSIGKKAVGISLRREADGSTLGFGRSFVRKLAHVLDSLPCHIGWLWPLWDEKKQTFADKVCGTVVVRMPKG
ncbi:putative RDD family membrane protein YckC [Streptomyces sp. 3211.6]|uniref:RDD family protein n=1 Tax=Streptomyces TaxID=1883 RepID=UPI0009A4C633|nr:MULTISPECIES: RDD family protein [Streptomyces]RKT02394.1 putative RDD family membrane protein YckC [Streptomyces sp. 3211.6]RPF43710.1 putative RDD family membrane protein YckC [Streptomyces sp. Ag109_G2-6]